MTQICLSHFSFRNFTFCFILFTFCSFLKICLLITCNFSLRPSWLCSLPGHSAFLMACRCPREGWQVGQGGAAGPWLSLWLWAPQAGGGCGGGDPPLCLQSCPETGGRCPLSCWGLGFPPGVRQQAALSARRSGPASWGSFCAGTSGACWPSVCFYVHMVLHEEVCCLRTSSCFE